jgi:hypothetical protein
MVLSTGETNIPKNRLEKRLNAPTLMHGLRRSFQMQVGRLENHVLSSRIKLSFPFLGLELARGGVLQKHPAEGVTMPLVYLNDMTTVHLQERTAVLPSSQGGGKEHHLAPSRGWSHPSRFPTSSLQASPTNDLSRRSFMAEGFKGPFGLIRPIFEPLIGERKDRTG